MLQIEEFWHSGIGSGNGLFGIKRPVWGLDPSFCRDDEHRTWEDAHRPKFDEHQRLCDTHQMRDDGYWDGYDGHKDWNDNVGLTASVEG